MWGKREKLMSFLKIKFAMRMQFALSEFKFNKEELEYMKNLIDDVLKEEDKHINDYEEKFPNISYRNQIIDSDIVFYFREDTGIIWGAPQISSLCTWGDNLIMATDAGIIVRRIKTKEAKGFKLYPESHTYFKDTKIDFLCIDNTRGHLYCVFHNKDYLPEIYRADKGDIDNFKISWDCIYTRNLCRPIKGISADDGLLYITPTTWPTFALKVGEKNV